MNQQIAGICVNQDCLMTGNLLMAPHLKQVTETCLDLLFRTLILQFLPGTSTEPQLLHSCLDICLGSFILAFLAISSALLIQARALSGSVAAPSLDRVHSLLIRPSASLLTCFLGALLRTNGFYLHLWVQSHGLNCSS